MSKKIAYEKVLNSSQLEAVMTLDGPILVIAGAGSGKTRTLVYRVARLVETGVPPESILLLTFTRKAAGEMLERAAGLADERCEHVSGGTFHALAHRVLRNNAQILGFHRTFTVLDRADMEEVVQSLVGELQIDRGSVRFPKRSTLASILSKSANRQQSIEALMGEEYAQFLEYIPHVNTLRSLYGEYKKMNHLMDYDDLILYFRQLLAENEDIRQHLSEQYRYIMVDEYQDTNSIQADIVKWLAFRHRNIMVVGDDSQSIYSFRGANYKNMFEFPSLFPETKVIKLEENYRSTQPILTFTNALMDQAQEKYTKCLFTERTDGEVPRVIDTRSEPEQAMFIYRSIRDAMSKGRSIKDFAILFRAAHHSFELEVELTRQGIPYVKYGGFKFMESAHIKDVLAHFRVILNRDDTVSWGRILRLVRNIGQGKSQSIINWMKKDRSLTGHVAEWPGAGKGDEGLKALGQLLSQISTKGLAPQKAVQLVIKYYEPILKEKFDDFPRRQRDLEQLIPMADRYRKLRTFLDDLVLEPPTSSADINRKERGDSLILSTVHSAKGLEWPFVFIIWAMEGYFPTARAYSNEEALEEERRLMYVAATRAKDQLIICYPSEEARPAWQWGETGYRSGLSSFIQALPHDVIEYGSSMVSETAARRGSPVRHAGIYQQQEDAPSELRPGDRVSHPAFGQGVISKFMDDEKVEVLFRDWGRKLLHLGYTTLEKM
ncbi:MAG: UvrD-helicase domain-containing protein [Deltaproteobacteria bacterium]|nr:MAG: UvrD-helicase domain-containing protein [Deltaproteobacteria bacterium]